MLVVLRARHTRFWGSVFAEIRQSAVNGRFRVVTQAGPVTKQEVAQFVH